MARSCDKQVNRSDYQKHVLKCFTTTNVMIPIAIRHLMNIGIQFHSEQALSKYRHRYKNRHAMNIGPQVSAYS